MTRKDRSAGGRPPRLTATRRTWLESLRDGQKHAVYRVRSEFAFPAAVRWVPKSRICAAAKRAFDDRELERAGCFYTLATGPREFFDSNGVQLGVFHPDWLVPVPSRAVGARGRVVSARSGALDAVADLFEQSKK